MIQSKEMRLLLLQQRWQNDRISTTSKIYGSFVPYLRRVPRTSILLGDRTGVPASEEAGVGASDPDPLEAGVKSPSLVTLGSLSELFSMIDDATLLPSTMENGLARILDGRGRTEARLLRGNPPSLRTGVEGRGVYDDARRGLAEGRLFWGERV